MWIWLVALALAGWLVARAPFLTDMSVFLPQRPTPEQRLLVQNLTEGVAARLLLAAVSGVEPARQAEFSSRFAQELRASPALASVNNGAMDGLRADQKLIFERRYQLSPSVSVAQFEVPALRAALTETVEQLLSSAGVLAGDLLLRDPTGETLRIVDRIVAGQSVRVFDGVWVSADARRLLLLIHTAAAAGDLDGQQAALDVVDQAFARTRSSVAAPAATLDVSGPGRFAVESRRSIREDVSRLSMLGTGLVLALLWVVFRSPWALALAVVPIASAVLAGAAATAVVFGSIHGLTLGFGATLVGESVDYALYHLARLASRDPTPKDVFWRTIRLGVATSVVGFGALLFTGFPGLAQLAVFSIAGLVTAATVTRWVLPLITPIQFLPPPLDDLDQRVKAGLVALDRAKRPLTAGVALVLLAALLLSTMRNVPVWDSDIAALNPVSKAAQLLHESLEKELGTTGADLMMVLRAADEDGALSAAHQMSNDLDSLVRDGHLSGFDSVSRLLPPAHVQRERQSALPDAAVLRERLREAGDGLPLRLDKLNAFVDDVQAARAADVLRRSDLVGTQLGIRVDSLLVGQGPVAALIALRAPPGRPLDIEDLRSRLKVPAGAQMNLLAFKAETDRLYASYLREATWLSIGGALAIVALLAMSLRSLRAVLLVCAPLAGAVLLVIAGFVLAGKPMNLLHLIGLLLVVAIGSNYALFLYSLRAGGLAMTPSSGTLASLVLANLTTLAGFLVLSLSAVPLLAALGTTVGAGTALALVLSGLWIGPQRARSGNPSC